jgi:delta24-sterol reductase
MGDELNRPLRPKKAKKSWVDYAVQLRWILVIFVVLPVSMAFDWWAYFGDQWSAWKSEEKRQKEFKQNVAKVVKRLKVCSPTTHGLTVSLF